jgi:hypothetical protein
MLLADMADMADMADEADFVVIAEADSDWWEQACS